MVVKQIAAVFVLCVGSGVFQPGTNPPPPPATQRAQYKRYMQVVQEHRAAIEARRRQIEQQLKSLSGSTGRGAQWASNWAGAYEGLSSTYYLAPSAGFVYIRTDDVGGWEGNAGDVTGTVAGGIKVKLLLDPNLDPLRYCSDTFYFANRGERRYLVPSSQMLEFCNWCNAQSGYATPSVYWPMTRLEDQKKPEGGVAIVPDEFRRFIFGAPVSARVTAVDQVERHGGSLNGTARLDRGDADGVYQGLRFWFRGGSGEQSLEVISATEHACTAKFVFDAPFVGSAEPPEVGQVISTGRPAHSTDRK